MTTVRHLLDQKPAEVWSLASTATVRQALRVMSEQDIGVVVVVDDTQVTGIFSERDFARRIAFDEGFSLNTPVSELMTSPSFFFRAPAMAPRTVWDCQPVASTILAMVAPGPRRT